MKKRKRFGKRRCSHGTPSNLRLDILSFPKGKCMKIFGQDELVTLAEWKRWFTFQGKYSEIKGIKND